MSSECRWCRAHTEATDREVARIHFIIDEVKKDIREFRRETLKCEKDVELTHKQKKKAGEVDEVKQVRAAMHGVRTALEAIKIIDDGHVANSRDMLLEASNALTRLEYSITRNKFHKGEN